jgi:hypothetical protein
MIICTSDLLLNPMACGHDGILSVKSFILNVGKPKNPMHTKKYLATKYTTAYIPKRVLENFWLLGKTLAVKKDEANKNMAKMPTGFSGFSASQEQVCSNENNM